MHLHTTASRGLAIAAGLAFAGGALTILLHDIIDLGHPLSMVEKWAMQHTLAVLTVVGVILAGELAREARLDRRYGKWAGFWLVILIGTFLVVYNSVGRQAESTGTTALSVEDRNDQRAEAKKSLAEHQRMLDEELAEHAREAAAGGCGKKCQGIEASIAVYKAAVAGDEAKIKALGAPEPDAPKAETFAELLSMIFGVNKAKAKALLTLIEPFAWTFLFEFGSIVSWGYVRRQPRKYVPTASDTAQTSFAWPDSSDDGSVLTFPKRPNPPPNSPKRRMVRSEVLSDLMLRNATGQTFRSQEEAALHYGVSPSRFSEWSKAWEAEGVLPRRMVGRCKQLTKA